MIEDVRTVEEMATAIKEMHVRGAGLIGAAAGYGMYLATLEGASGTSFEDDLMAAAAQLKATRPTAVNLAWAIERQLKEHQCRGGRGREAASSIRNCAANSR